MVRRTLAALAFVLLPLGLEAQATSGIYEVNSDGIHPLRTWCTTALQTNCVSLFSWHFEYVLDGGGTQSEAGYRAEIGITTSLPLDYFAFLPWTLTEDGWTGPFVDWTPSPLANGHYIVSDESNVGVITLRPSTPSDPIVIWFGAETCVTASGITRFNLPTCVSVPEPNSLLLVASGFGGVVFAGRRRRRILS